jgi:hypothetical protein
MLYALRATISETFLLQIKRKNNTGFQIVAVLYRQG